MTSQDARAFAKRINDSLPDPHDYSQPFDINKLFAADTEVEAHQKTIGPGLKIGQILRFLVGDGYATYIVVEVKPRTVVVEHIALGDGYRARDAVSARNTVSRAVAMNHIPRMR